MHTVTTVSYNFWEDAPDRFATNWDSALPWVLAITATVIAVGALVWVVNSRVANWIGLVPAVPLVFLVSAIVRHLPSDRGAAGIYFALIVGGGLLLLLDHFLSGWVLVGGGAIYGIVELITRIAGSIPISIPGLLFIVFAVFMWVKYGR